MPSISLPTAIIGSAAISGAGALASSAIGSSAAKNAANAQVQASNNALDFQRQVFNTTQGNLSPYNQGGQGSLNALLGLTSANNASAPGGPDWNAYLSQNPDVAQYYTTHQQELAQQGITTPQQWAQTHYQANGQKEGRALPTLSASTDASGQAPPVGTPGASGPTGGALSSPLLAPYGANAPTYTPYSVGVPQYTPFNMTESELQKTPGYQFNLTQGLKAVQNAAAARGLGVSGAALKGAANFATGLADSTYQNQFANYVTNYQNQLQGQQAGLGQHVTDYTNQLNNWMTNYNAYTGQQQAQYNRLLGLAGLGENAAAQSGNIATQQSGQIGNTITGLGNAQAGGIVGSANALTGGISNATGSISNSLILNQLLKNQNGGGLFGNGAYQNLYSNPLTLAPNTLMSPANDLAGNLNSYLPDVAIG